jgi:hypothetical protein
MSDLVHTITWPEEDEEQYDADHDDISSPDGTFRNVGDEAEDTMISDISQNLVSIPRKLTSFPLTYNF